MKRYVYVVALTDSKNTAEMTDPHDMISFKLAFVEAEDETAAYDAGFDAVVLSSTETRCNDYVVEVP
jgi:hypothetical protein